MSKWCSKATCAIFSFLEEDLHLLGESTYNIDKEKHVSMHPLKWFLFLNKKIYVWGKKNKIVKGANYHRFWDTAIRVHFHLRFVALSSSPPLRWFSWQRHTKRRWSKRSKRGKICITQMTMRTKKAKPIVLFRRLLCLVTTPITMPFHGLGVIGKS